MTRALTILLAGTLAMTSCGGNSRHPGKSIGIEGYRGVKDLYELAESQRKKHGLPALGLGIVRDGTTIGLGMAGERRSGSGDWATLDDRFDVASCSKSVTATVAAMLVERGVVRWDVTVKEVFPELRQSIQAAYADVTLEMLLRHRSGLDRWMSTNERWSAWHRDHAQATATEQRRLFAATVLENQPRYTPGADSYYTNDAYLVAGSMIERVSGKAWEDSVRAMLFEPLGLTSMRFGVPPPGTAPVAWGHHSGFFGRPRSIAPDPAEYGAPPFGSPSGFLYSSVADLLSFVDFHIKGANGNATLLSRDSFTRLHAPLGNQPFAMGWEVETTRDRQGKTVERSIYHGGFSGRFRANIWFAPESRTGTVIVYNHGGDDKATACADIFQALLQDAGLRKTESR